MQKRLSRKKIRSNIKRFSKKSVDYASYVSDFYLENGIAFISCKTNGIYSIISQYSVKEYEWLNEEFASFVESNAYYIPNEYPIVLEICGNYNSEEKKIIDETIHDFYSLKLGDKQIDLYNNGKTIKQTIVISVVGFAVMLLTRALSADWPLVEIASTFYGIFAWKIADLLFERSYIKAQKIDAAQLASMKIKFTKKFIDSEIDDEIAKKVNEDVFEN